MTDHASGPQSPPQHHADIRPATSADIPACARIVRDWELSTGYLPDVPPLDMLIDAIAQAFPDRLIWVTGHPVDGYLSLDPTTARIGAIYLTDRGTGIGKRLIDLAKQGRDHLWLTVYIPNTRARAFYARQGFTHTATLPPEGTRPGMHRMDWHRQGPTK